MARDFGRQDANDVHPDNVFEDCVKVIKEVDKSRDSDHDLVNDLDVAKVPRVGPLEKGIGGIRREK